MVWKDMIGKEWKGIEREGNDTNREGRIGQK
jgi:hypothetical protein